jgi:SAM-dependent methyltransferase
MIFKAVSACPACASSSRGRTSALAEGFACEVSDASLQHPAYQVSECGDCGLYYKTATLRSDELARYYAELEYEPFNLPDAFPTDVQLTAVLDDLPPGSRILDYGCSTGRILASLRGDFVLTGVEPNLEAADVARSRGIEIVADADLENRARDGFDAIVLTDVFEHLERPVEVLQRLSRLLRPEGLLVLVTGLGDAVRPQDLLPEHWYFRIPGHLQMASIRHLHWLGRRLGLSEVAMNRCCHYSVSPYLRLRQKVQLAAYSTFALRPRSLGAHLLRLVPFVNRARDWPNMPATTSFSDHVIATFRKMGADG